MDTNTFLALYDDILFDKRGRVNANLSRSKNYIAIAENASALTADFPKHVTLAQRLICLRNNVLKWPTCEVCPNPVKMTAQGKFTPFCCFKCSRAKGSSTFLKAQSTCIEKYGVKSNLVTAEQLNAKRLNGGIGLANSVTKEKVKNTNIAKYGYENVFQSESIKTKIKKSHDIKYGGNFQTMRLGKKIELLADKEYCLGLSKHFCMSSICNLLGVASNTVYKYFLQHGITNFNNQRSNQEVEMFEFIRTLTSEEIICGDRKQLGGLELDLYVPAISLGIEMHGLYWHSERAGASPSAHLKKLKLATSKNIRLLQIFESEWALKREIVKSRIRSIFGKSRKIFARKCQVKPIKHTDANSFFTENHLQGNTNASSYIGLFSGETLVAAMSFNKTRFDKSADFELLRFSNLLNTTVVGGFQKLLSHFRKMHPNSSIVSYADKRWSLGDVYKKSNFELVSESTPSYHYFFKSNMLLENRIKFQKHKLPKILETFNSELSEWDNMRNAGYNRIWDCGTTKWILINSIL